MRGALGPASPAGGRAAVDLPEARWPGGTADRMRDVDADRCVTVVEGSRPADR